MSAWQPITTAPRDGNAILLALFGGTVMQVCYWDEDQGAAHPWHVEDADVSYAAGAPTHWQPLPEPPDA